LLFLKIFKLKIKSILVSQPKPEMEKSPYFDLASKYNLKIDFRPFVKVEGISSKEFRLTKINIPDYSAIIFTSKTAINHFFQLCEELRIIVSDNMKYFCNSESIALFLQKYIVYRKRKIFYGNGNFENLVEILTKHETEHFLVPCSDIHKEELPNGLESTNLKFKRVILYKTLSSDLSDLKDINYNILVFFSPSGIKSLFVNFPDFVQNETKIAAFGTATAKAVTDAGLRLDIQAPLPEAPSMTMALDQYIKKFNNNNK
jgi:uroporphyrinogen-III synthase